MKVWMIESEIREDDHRECFIGPFIDKPTLKQAERLCLAYTGVPHDGTHDASLEIIQQTVYQNIAAFVKGTNGILWIP